MFHFYSMCRLIYDPATGRPRGFGFCEYEDGETAMSAVRNLAGREVNGRPLRIDSATNAPGGEFRGPGGHTWSDSVGMCVYGWVVQDLRI